MNRVALIPIKGVVISEKSPFATAGITSSADIIPMLAEVGKKREMKALVLEINSPGGTPFACKEIASAIKAIKKPKVAWVREMAASGGYWVASAADIIVADSLSTIGSVGVTSMRPDISELLKKLGIDMNVIATGTHKLFGVPFKPLTSDEKQEDKRWRQEEIELIQKSFLEELTQNRHLTEEVINEISSGKTYLGQQAKEMGLIDEFGGKGEALKTAAEKVGIKTYKVIDYSKKLEKRKRSLLGRLLGFF
jgi:protease-4